jgi:hypothetical protein
VKLVSNPVRGIASIRWSLAVAGPARVTVFDVAGRAVAGRNLVLGRAGTLDLDLRHLAGGVYLVKLSCGDVTASQKLVIER